VIGVLPGTDQELSEEVVVIGAHVDHLGKDPVSGGIYYGADDNASGTAVVMELARAFVLGGHKTARTVVFAAWNAEELGLIGSCEHVENPSFPISQTVAAWSIDMVGAGDGSGLPFTGRHFLQTDGLQM
jgi:Zn-dependent M28 family amino/carboxypeptidase